MAMSQPIPSNANLMNNPYLSFMICSIIKFIFYVILYKAYVHIRNYFKRKQVSSNIEPVVSFQGDPSNPSQQ